MKDKAKVFLKVFNIVFLPNDINENDEEISDFQKLQLCNLLQKKKINLLYLVFNHFIKVFHHVTVEEDFGGFGGLYNVFYIILFYLSIYKTKMLVYAIPSFPKILSKTNP